MSTMPDRIGFVIGGVDTHRDVHTGAAVDRVGAVLATASFETTAEGYRQLLGWLRSFGTVAAVGVEGTGSWGAGLTRHLLAAGVEVREVARPNRQYRRRHGKSDSSDAVAAARSVLNGEASGVPRGGSGPVESLRLLRVARSSAIKQRTATGNQILSVVVTAPEPLRASLTGATVTTIAAVAGRYRPTPNTTDPHQAAKIALRSLTQRWNHLTAEIDQLDTHLAQLVQAAAPPALLAETGVGVHTAADLLIAAGANPHRLHSAASFAALCGTSPIEASSGNRQRHRLNRGGDRQANAALYRIVIVRLRYHQPTRDYMTRRLAEGKTKREIIRCLKRHLARHIYQHLTHPQTNP
jgi:transposase